MQISQEALKEAYAEINALRKERRQSVGWNDDVYQFCVDALGDYMNRSPDRITWRDIVKILHERGWMTGAENTIKESFRKERARRRNLNEGE